MKPGCWSSMRSTFFPKKSNMYGIYLTIKALVEKHWKLNLESIGCFRSQITNFCRLVRFRQPMSDNCDLEFFREVLAMFRQKSNCFISPHSADQLCFFCVCVLRKRFVCNAIVALVVSVRSFSINVSLPNRLIFFLK